MDGLHGLQIMFWTGQNVRLASKISGWNLDVTSESEYNKDLKDSYNSLLSLEGVGEAIATELYQEGFRSIEDIASTSVDELANINGLSKKDAAELIVTAKEYLKEGDEKPSEPETAADEGTEEDMSPDGEK